MEMLRELGFCSGSRTTRGSSTAAGPATGRTACSTTSPTISSASSTSPTRPSRRSAACPRGTAPASRRSSTSGSGSERARQPSADLPGVPLDHPPDGVRVRHPRRVRAIALAADRRADRAPDRDHRPRGGGARDAQPDRRPDERDPRARRARTSARWSRPDQEDGRGPHRLPARDGVQGALPAFRDRHARADPDHPRAAVGRVRRAGRGQPAARRARPAGGVAGWDPRCRQGGLPPRRDVADPDDRPRRPERRGQGSDVRRQGDRGDARRDRRDRPPPGQSSGSTTSSTGSPRRRSSRGSPTSPSS